MAASIAALTHLRDAALALFFVSVAWPLWILPWRGATTLGRWYGYIVYLFWAPGRRTGMINLRHAYGPDMTRRTARRWTRAVVGSLGQGFAEGAQFARHLARPGWNWEAVHEPEDPDLEQRILADPRPKIFVSGHLGSWEVALAMAGQRVGARGAAIVRRVDNPFINAILRRIRVSHPEQWIDKQGAAGQALERLRSGGSIALLLDENAGHRGVFVDFFGRPASTSRLAAQLSLMTGAPVVVGAALRQEGRRTFLFRLAVFEPPGMQEGPDGVQTMTARIVRQWKDWVRQAPLQWRWVHWRWKTRPDGSLETYGRRDVAACFDSEGGGRPDQEQHT